MKNDIWGSGVAGRPSALIDGGGQHTFARGTGGTLEHYFWDPASGFQHDTWGAGIAGDPVARLIAGQWHVWAIDGAGALQHFWRDAGPAGRPRHVGGERPRRPADDDGAG